MFLKECEGEDMEDPSEATDEEDEQEEEDGSGECDGEEGCGSKEEHGCIDPITPLLTQKSQVKRPIEATQGEPDAEVWDTRTHCGAEADLPM